MIDTLLTYLAPHSCCGCQNIGTLLCDKCKYDIISEPYSACIGCQKPTWESNFCGACKQAWVVEDGWCVGYREGSLKSLIDRYKFSSARQAGAICSSLLDEVLPILPDDIVVVPVPTAPAHARSRGFDHAVLFARHFAKARKLRYAGLLRRTGGATQHFKSRAERLRTASAGLEVAGSVPEAVLLLDDICTTGATLQACVRVLRTAGAKQVYVGIIARQPLG